MKKLYSFIFVSVIVFSGVLLFPKLSHASSLLAAQPVSDTSTGNQAEYLQKLLTPIAGQISSITLTGQVRVQVPASLFLTLYEVTPGNATTTYSFSTPSNSNTSVAPIIFTPSGTVNINPANTYYIFTGDSSSGTGGSMTLFGTTSASYSGCRSNTTVTGGGGWPTGTVPCSNSVTSLAYTITNSQTIAFNNPVQYSTNDSSAPSGVDFSSWTIQVNQIAATSTPLIIFVNTSLGQSSLVLPASSTCATCFNNFVVPKNYTLTGVSTSSPTIYNATAILQSTLSSTTIASVTTYFGVFAPGSSFTQGNFFTTSGYSALQSASTTAASGCDRFSGFLLAPVNGLCDLTAWLLIPNSSQIQNGVAAIHSIFDTKIPFAYLTAIQAQIQSDDCIGVSGCVIPTTNIPSAVFTFSTGLATITTPSMFSVSNMQHFFGSAGITFRTIAYWSMWLSIGMAAFWTAFNIF